MKTCRLLSIAVLAMAMSLVSCSGDDGEQGPQGVPGKDGTNGTNGVDGTDGTNGISCWDLNGNGTGDADEDINQDGNFDALDCQGEDGTNGIDGTNGNANVQRFDILITDFSGNALNFSMPIGAAELPNYAFLFYLKNTGNAIFPVPGPISGNNQYTRVFYDEDNGNATINFYNTSDNSNYVLPAGLYTTLRIVAIELSNTQKNGTSVWDELKAAGVDTNDYHAVAKYFGLE